MKALGNILVIGGLLLLLGAVLGRFIGDPRKFLGIYVASLMLLSNTAFLLAILVKLPEKK